MAKLEITEKGIAIMRNPNSHLINDLLRTYKDRGLDVLQLYIAMLLCCDDKGQIKGNNLSNELAAFIDENISVINSFIPLILKNEK